MGQQRWSNRAMQVPWVGGNQSPPGVLRLLRPVSSRHSTDEALWSNAVCCQCSSGVGVPFLCNINMGQKKFFLLKGTNGCMVCAPSAFSVGQAEKSAFKGYLEPAVCCVCVAPFSI